MKAKARDPYPEREWCPICGWRKDGKDSWNGYQCKCGYSLDPDQPSRLERHGRLVKLVCSELFIIAGAMLILGWR